MFVFEYSGESKFTSKLCGDYPLSSEFDIPALDIQRGMKMAHQSE